MPRADALGYPVLLSFWTHSKSYNQKYQTQQVEREKIMGIFEAQTRNRTAPEDKLVSAAFGTLEVLDQSKFLVPILKQCGVELGEEIDPDGFRFTYWDLIDTKIPDVILRHKSALIFIECKLGSPLNIKQLVAEYEDGIREQTNFWLIAVTKDDVKPEEVIDNAKKALENKGHKDPRIQWINWQEIYKVLNSNVKIANQTEQKLIRGLLRLLEVKKLRAFKFDVDQLNYAARLYPEWAVFQQEYTALFEMLSGRLQKEGITSAHFSPDKRFMRAWDNEWTEKKASQGLLMRIPYLRSLRWELEIGYRLRLQPNLRDLFIKAARGCALAERLSKLSNCSISYYGRGYELLVRLTGDGLNDEAFNSKARGDAEFLVIGRVFSHVEMSSLALLDDAVKYLVNIRDIINENQLYFPKQATKDLATSETPESEESEDD